MDYSKQIHDLNVAAEICRHHTITQPVNGVQPEYPRWPEAWKACEKVWQSYLDLQPMLGATDEEDRRTVIRELDHLR